MMDGNTYNTKMQEILAPLPTAFQNYVSMEAYDRGHSAGYEEVLGIAGGMVYDLQKAITQYESDKARGVA